MTEQQITKAKTRVSQAQAELDRALSSGAPTADLRETLTLAADELRRVQAASLVETGERQAETAKALDAEAVRMASEAALDLTFAVQDLGLVSPPEPALPVSVARALVAAKHQEAEHNAKGAEHEAHLSALRARLTDLSETRGKTIARRAEGHCEPSDGPTLTLLDADIEGVRGLIARTEAEGPGPDRSGVSEWSKQWDQAIARERGAILANVAVQLDGRLAAVLDQIRANGTGPWFRPSAALEAALRSL